MMKVQCVALLDSDGNRVTSSPWLTLGKVYPVLGILWDEHGKKSFQIIADGSSGVLSLGYYPSECFEVISAYRPSCWRDRIIDGVIREISPADWQKDNFWVEVFDADPEANRIFQTERDAMLSEEKDIKIES